MKLPIRIKHHLVVTDSEHLVIINALAFYRRYHTSHLIHDKDELDQFSMAFREDNRGVDIDGPVMKLETKIANSN
jgi:hypothetical protein